MTCMSEQRETSFDLQFSQAIGFDSSLFMQI